MKAVNLLPTDVRGASKADRRARRRARRPRAASAPFVVLGVLAACVAAPRATC